MSETTVARSVIPEWSLADRLRKAREHAGLEQTELAELIGLSRASISTYETGRVRPKRPQMLAISMATGVPLTWIATGQAAAEADRGPDDTGGGLPQLDSNQQPAG